VKPFLVDHLDLDPGRRLAVRRWAGHGRPLVLLHGLLDDSMGWEQLAGDTHRPCFALDLPGFGGSSRPTRPRISAYAEDVCRGIEELDIDDCTLVGHSLGGAVAAAVAERCPAVQSLVLLAPAGFGPNRIAEAVALPGVIDLAQAALPLGLVNPLVVAGAYSTFVAHRQLPSRDLLDRLRRRAFQSGPGVRMAVQAIAAAGRSHRGFAHRRIAFDGPVAAVWGAHDALVDPGQAAAVKRALPQARVEVWRGMGHHPQRERPQQLNAFIERQAWNARTAAWRRGIHRAA
jgi:pimeloyl-ACP methyl ester carboxylesterase